MGMVSEWMQATDEEIVKLRADPSLIRDFFEGEGDGFYLDKAWHAIHFMLTGTADPGTGPLRYIIGGEPLATGEDLVACSLSSADVREFDDALSAIPPEDFARRYDRAAIARAGVLPGLTAEAPDGIDDDFEYLADYYDLLRKGVRAAREKGVGLVTCLC